MTTNTIDIVIDGNKNIMEEIHQIVINRMTKNRAIFCRQRDSMTYFQADFITSMEKYIKELPSDQMFDEKLKDFLKTLVSNYTKKLDYIFKLMVDKFYPKTKLDFWCVINNDTEFNKLCENISYCKYYIELWNELETEYETLKKEMTEVFYKTLKIYYALV